MHKKLYVAINAETGQLIESGFSKAPVLRKVVVPPMKKEDITFITRFEHDERKGTAVIHKKDTIAYLYEFGLPNHTFITQKGKRI